jgi:hypothetical protein
MPEAEIAHRGGRSTWLSKQLAAGAAAPPRATPPAAEPPAAGLPAAPSRPETTGVAASRNKNPEAPPPGRESRRTTAAAADDRAAASRPARRRREASMRGTGGAPRLGERQTDRWHVRLTPTLLEAVRATEERIAAATGLSRNDIRQIALWEALGDADGADTFIRDVLPAWQEARIKATQHPPTQDG